MTRRIEPWHDGEWADCSDFYYEPTDTDRIGFRAPDDVVAALENTACSTSPALIEESGTVRRAD